MKTALDETFHKGKLEELYHRWHQAQEEYASPYSKNQQIISLTAPTGAGKTLIMTALIEAIYRGHTPYPAQENAIFLWLSDMPDLNEQSRLKIMRELTPSIPSYRFVTIEGETFDQRTLKDKYVYFINTQKLGDKKNLVDKGGGDHRQYTFWDTLRNTIELGRSFVSLEYQKEALPLMLLLKGLMHSTLVDVESRHTSLRTALGQHQSHDARTCADIEHTTSI